MKRSNLEAFAVFSILLPLCAFLNFRTPLVADADSFYHFGHAQIYLQRGIIDQHFPWTAYSATGVHQADIWWGFHVVLVPFAAMHDPVVGMKLASCVMLSLGGFLLYIAARWLTTSRVAFAAPFIFLLASSVELNRLIALRPQSISFGLSALVFVAAVKGHWRATLFASLALAFIHQTLSWIGIAVAGIVFLTNLIVSRSLAWEPLVASISGILLGFVARPGAIEALRLLKIQLLDLSAAKTSQVPLPFGSEVYKLTPQELVTGFGLFTILWLGGLIWLAVNFKQLAIALKVSALASAAVSIIGFQLTMFSTLRGVELWLVFATLIMLLQLNTILQLKKNALFAVCTGVSVILASLTVPRHIESLDRHGIQPNRMKPTMAWLSDNSRGGDLVASVFWDLFGEMFFHNKKNVYIEGMDPIFLYAVEPDKFWMLHYFERGIATARTSKTAPDHISEPIPTYDAFKNEFNARFILIVRPSSQALSDYLRSERRFSLAFVDGPYEVFEVL